MIEHKIQQAAHTNTFGHLMLAEVDATRLSHETEMTLEKIYKAALELDVWPERYVRNAGSFSCTEQGELLNAVVAVAGCGGLGGYIAQLLARMGVGELRLFDPDHFEASNLNRQVFASGETLGMDKAETARQAIATINPSVLVSAHRLDVNSEEARKHLANVDLIADGLDTIADRARLSNLARKLAVPMVHATISGFEARVMVLWPDGPSFGDLFGSDAETTAESTLGTPAVTPAVAAGFQCTQIVRVLLGKLSPKDTPMVHIDLMEMRSEIFHF